MELEGHLPPGPRAAPWMVFSHGIGMKDQTFFNLCEPIHGNTFRKCIPELSGKSFWQSPSNRGWLIILCNKDDDDDTHYSDSPNKKCKLGDCFLWNPATLETIQLPNMSHLIGEGADQYHVVNPVMSSSLNRVWCKSLVIFLLYRNKFECVVVYCRPMVDKVWTMQKIPTTAVTVGRVFSFNGMFYISQCPMENGIIELKVLRKIFNEPVLSSDYFFKSTHLDLSTRLGRFPTVFDYYVDSCDELFRVVQIFHPNPVKKKVFAIEIFRLDFSSLTWVEVKSLGDHVLFLGAHTMVSCSATEMGLTRGCVYFTLYEDMSLYKFDLEEDSISVSLPCLNLTKPWNSQDWIMIIPNVMIRADGNGSRRIEDISSTTNMKEECINVNKSELEKPTYWGMLNGDMVALISTYLHHPVDHTNFRAVCKVNQLSVAKVNWKTASASKIIPATFCPWLVFSRKDDPTTYNFTDPIHNGKYQLRNLFEFETKIRFSKGGWLLMSSGKKTLFFFNPFTREKIQLPDLPDIYEYMFYGISFSSPPTSSDCTVFAITEWFQGGEAGHSVFVFFISRGDSSWSYRLLNNPRFPYNGKFYQFIPGFNNPVFHKGYFFCLDHCGALGVFKLKDNFSWKLPGKPRQYGTSPYQTFLVECDGELLYVFIGHLGRRLLICKVDFSKKALVQVESLGKHMLFISYTSCISAVAPKSCMEDTIYLSRFHGEGVLFYSLATRRFHAVGSQHSGQDFRNTREQLNCSWIEPNWSLTTSQEQLDWLKHPCA